VAVTLPDYSPLAKGKDSLLDVVRGMCMFFVIVVHVGYGKINPFGTGLLPVTDAWWFDVINWLIVWGLGFFVIAGALSRRASGVKLTTWWRQRALRLLMPYYVFAAIMVPVELVIKYAAPDGVCGNFSLKKVATWILPLHTDCLGLAQGPFWFLMTFIPIVLAAPLLLKVYDSRWRFAAPVLGLVALVFFDLGLITNKTVIHFDQFLGQGNMNGGLILVLMVHVFLFWSLQFYLGFFYADGYSVKMAQKRLLLPISLGLMALAALGILSGVYPHNPWGWWKTTCDNYSCDGNQFPATLVFMAASVGGYLFLVWARRAFEALADVAYVGRSLKWLSSRSLTIMIWHMIAYEIVYWTIRGAGWLPTIEGLPQILQRPLFIALVVPLTIVLVKIFYPLETIDWNDFLSNRLKGLVRSRRTAVAQPAEAASASRAQR